MAPILWPQTTAPGVREQEGGGRLINCYAEDLAEGGPAPYVIRRAPGLAEFAAGATSGESPTTLSGYRGGFFVSPYLYEAFSGVLVRVDADGVVTKVGDLAGSDIVTFARNNRTPTPDFVAVCAAGPVTFTSSAVSAWSDADLPSPVSVCFIDGYFFLAVGDGRCFASGLNATAINANDFTRAESRPGGLLRGIAYQRELFLFGPDFIEVWRGDTPNDTGFPFNRVTTIWVGLAGFGAVAGMEPGFSAGLLWVADDGAVHQLNGYSTVKVSPPDLDRLIAAVADKSTLRASVYVEGGHPCWCLDGPDWTWVFDLATRRWHERRSYLREDWRFVGPAIQSFGEWRGGDKLSGRTLTIREETFREVGEPLVFRAESIEMSAFPARLRVPDARINLVGGVGYAGGEQPIETDPQAAVSWSDDGGRTWSTPLLRPIGSQGIMSPDIHLNRLGLTGRRGRRWAVEVTDPVYVGLLGGAMSVEPRP